MTPEQQEAIQAVRDLLAELPARPSFDALDVSWWALIRGTLRQVTAAFAEDDEIQPLHQWRPVKPEGGDQ